MRKVLKYFFTTALITCLVIAFNFLFKEGTREYRNYQIKKVAGVSKEDFKPDWDALKKINPDIVAWIYYPATEISYPVVQCSDNNYYLKHDFNKNVNEEGTVFLDCDNQKDFTDKNNILYGHTIFGWRGMFSGLKDLLDENFFDTHNKFILFTPEATYRCDIFSFESTRVNGLSYQMEFAMGNQIVSWSDQIKQQSLYKNDKVKIGKNSRVLTLSTCAAMNSNQRYIVHARMEVDKKIKSSDIN